MSGLCLKRLICPGMKSGFKNMRHWICTKPVGHDSSIHTATNVLGHCATWNDNDPNFLICGPDGCTKKECPHHPNYNPERRYE